MSGGTRFVIGSGLGRVSSDVDLPVVCVDAGREFVESGWGWSVFDVSGTNIEAGPVPWAIKVINRRVSAG